MNEEQGTTTSKAPEVKTETAPQTETQEAEVEQPEAPVSGDEPMDEKTEINKLLDGYVDAYYGPAELKSEIESGEKKSPQTLTDDLAHLRDLIPVDNPSRYSYLTAIMRAIDCTLRKLNGEEFDYLDEVNRLFDIKPDKIVVTTCEEGRGNGIIRIMRKHLGEEIWLDDRYYYAFDHTKFMHRGHIVFQKSQWGEITRRPFEAAACKKMVMLDELEADTGIKDMFRDGVDAVYYHSWEDAVEKINYYKDRLDEVAKIAKSGYDRVMENHTVEHRANRILELVETL